MGVGMKTISIYFRFRKRHTIDPDNEVVAIEKKKISGGAIVQFCKSFGTSSAYTYISCNCTDLPRTIKGIVGEGLEEWETRTSHSPNALGQYS